MIQNPFLLTLFGNIIIAFGIILVIQVIKLFKPKITNNLEYLTSLTVGLLLAIVFLGFLPEIIHEGGLEEKPIGIYILVGLLSFHILELLFHWHHCKDLEHKSHSCGHGHVKEHKNNSLIFFGTFIHNAFHGFELFSAYSINFNVGLVTTIAILLHSIPQNIANYIMNHHKTKYAYIAASGGILGALLTYPLSTILSNNEGIVLCIISGGLLYIALADILPSIKEKSEMRPKIKYLGFIILGILLFGLFNSIIGEHH